MNDWPMLQLMFHSNRLSDLDFYADSVILVDRSGQLKPSKSADDAFAAAENSFPTLSGLCLDLIVRSPDIMQMVNSAGNIRWKLDILLKWHSVYRKLKVTQWKSIPFINYDLLYNLLMLKPKRIELHRLFQFLMDILKDGEYDCPARQAIVKEQMVKLGHLWESPASSTLSTSCCSSSSSANAAIRNSVVLSHQKLPLTPTCYICHEFAAEVELLSQQISKTEPKDGDVPSVQPHTCQQQVVRLCKAGAELAGFFYESGWFDSAKHILSCCSDRLMPLLNSPLHEELRFDLLVRYSQACLSSCDYAMAEMALGQCQSLIESSPVADCLQSTSKAVYCIAQSALLFSRSSYKDAYDWGKIALGFLETCKSPVVVVDVIRYMTKLSVVKRHFKQSNLLIKFLVRYAREHLGESNLKYADVLLEYAFHLLHMDFAASAVEVHKAVLGIRQRIFASENNVLVAMAHEDLAYALYVLEYNTGRFNQAFSHSVVGLNRLTYLLAHDHFLLSSAKRVKALIIEEIALEHRLIRRQLLEEAESLHLSSLSIAKRVFGENNLQTAKHYGNLGRLYQSMQKYNEAEEMHLKAIEIKERLMGSEDYEVALSVGHLASLYNYDLKSYAKAEQLYLRAISIGEKLFGPGYSGLEYDYRGLQRVYRELGDTEKSVEYELKLFDWYRLRQQHNVQDSNPLAIVNANNPSDPLQPSANSANNSNNDINADLMSAIDGPFLPSVSEVLREFFRLDAIASAAAEKLANSNSSTSHPEPEPRIRNCDPVAP